MLAWPCTGFRIERCLDRLDRRTEARRHLFEHMIAADTYPVASDLHIGVPVAEMPCKPDELERRMRGDLDERLRLSGHQHAAAIVEHDAVAVAKDDCFVKVEKEFGAALALERDAAAMPVAGIEHHDIDSTCRIPETGAANRPAALHGRTARSHNMLRHFRREAIMPNTSTLPAKFSAAGEGNVYARANVATCKITATDTGGAFEIFDEQCKPGFESRLHLHTKSFQACYVIEGSGEFQIGDQVFRAETGACINIPPGVPHKVGSRAGMRMLMIYSPPGLEGMMRAMKALSPEQLADGALTSRILAEHDTVVLGEDAGSRGAGSVLG